jgi:hypothetical protein
MKMGVWCRIYLFVCASALIARHAAATDAAISIPARLDKRSQLIVEARVNHSRPLSFALDSGSGDLVYLGESTARELGLLPTSSGITVGPSRREILPEKRLNVTMTLEDLVVADQPLVITPRVFEGFDGVIGLSVLKEYIIQLDHRTPSVRLSERQRFQRPKGTVIPLTMTAHRPFVNASVRFGSKNLPAQLMVDTGAGAIFIYLTKSYINRTGLAVRAGPISCPEGKDYCMTRASQFSTGAIEIDHPAVVLAKKRGFGDQTEPDGLLGTDFFRRFTVTLDLIKGWMLLDSN